MKIYKNTNLKNKHCKGVLAIGNFDGIHLGHQKVIKEAMKKANKAQVFGKSSRGNKTKDTYSLMGFTDAYNSARKNCKN